MCYTRSVEYTRTIYTVALSPSKSFRKPIAIGPSSGGWRTVFLGWGRLKRLDYREYSRCTNSTAIIRFAVFRRCVRRMLPVLEVYRGWLLNQLLPIPARSSNYSYRQYSQCFCRYYAGTRSMSAVGNRNRSHIAVPNIGRSMCTTNTSHIRSICKKRF